MRLLQWHSGVATGGMGGSGPPTSVQTPPEICANPLKSVLIYREGPMHVYCYFLLLISEENFFGPPTFLGWRHHYNGMKLMEHVMKILERVVEGRVGKIEKIDSI